MSTMMVSPSQYLTSCCLRACPFQGASRRDAFTSLGCGRGLLLPVGFTLGDFRVGQSLFAGIASGSLQRYLVLLGPEALQVRFALCRLDGGIARGRLRLQVHEYDSSHHDRRHAEQREQPCVHRASPQKSVRKPDLNVRPGRIFDAFSQLAPYVVTID
jgi:hypothetical protein